ncbi:TPA: hypothetical protein I7682_17700 [Vibrio vulnificus]|nr:hypothetical protein [Vibrio vulnificus]
MAKLNTTTHESAQLVFQCARQLINTPNEKIGITKTIKDHESQGLKHHALYREGNLFNQKLFVVSGATEGIAFAEAVKQSVSHFPVLGITIVQSGNVVCLHTAYITHDKGTLSIRETKKSITTDEDIPSPYLSLIKEVKESKGQVVFYNSGTINAAKGVKELEVLATEVRSLSSLTKGSITLKGGRSQSAPTSAKTMLLGGCIAAAIIGSFLFTSMQEEELRVVVEKKAVEDAFIQKIESGFAPKTATLELYRLMVGEIDQRNQFGLRNSIPGWTAKAMTIDRRQIVVQMEGSKSASLESIRQAANKLNLALGITGANQVTLVRTFDPDCLPPVLAKPTKMPIEPIVSYVFAHLSLYFPEAQTKLGKLINEKGHASQSLEITIPEASEETVDTIGTILNHLPINVDSIKLRRLSEDGIYSVTMTTQIYGCSVSDLNNDGLCR